ncbi:MAG: hypothetical protein GY696_30895 [Gammaproteobacteria bacterium]|nr:hypothetical protein [Gammaproteobacteria bacterium]
MEVVSSDGEEASPVRRVVQQTIGIIGRRSTTSCISLRGKVQLRLGRFAWIFTMSLPCQIKNWEWRLGLNTTLKRVPTLP